MHKKLFFLSLTACVLLCHSLQAKVRFIMEKPDSDYGSSFSNSDSSSNNNYDSNPIMNRCEEAGYTKIHCDVGMVLRNPCPYISGYYADCCPEDYRYSANECRRQGKTTSTYSCAGYYACY